MVKSWQKSYKDIDIYYIGYVTVKKLLIATIFTGKSFALNDKIDKIDKIDKMVGHFGEKNGNKYLVLDDLDENKEVWKKHKEVWEGVKKEIETINGGKNIAYGKDF